MTCPSYCKQLEARHLVIVINKEPSNPGDFMLKFVLFNKNIHAWVLIGRQHSHKPIGGHSNIFYNGIALVTQFQLLITHQTTSLMAVLFDQTKILKTKHLAVQQ